MKGKILGYNKTTQIGVISGEDGNRYQFKRENWESPNEPTVGHGVDFNVENDNAVEIYRSISDNSVTLNLHEKNKFIAALLAFFLGSFGAHKFYLGYSKQGIIMLCVAILGAIVFLPTAVIAIIAIIECILYLTKSDEEFQRVYVDNKRPWF